MPHTRQCLALCSHYMLISDSDICDGYNWKVEGVARSAAGRRCLGLAKQVAWEYQRQLWEAEWTDAEQERSDFRVSEKKRLKKANEVNKMGREQKEVEVQKRAEEAEEARLELLDEIRIGKKTPERPPILPSCTLLCSEGEDDAFMVRWGNIGVAHFDLRSDPGEKQQMGGLFEGKGLLAIDNACISDLQWEWFLSVLQSGVKGLVVASELPFLWGSREDAKETEAVLKKKRISTGVDFNSPGASAPDATKEELTVQSQWINRPRVQAELLDVLFQWRDMEEGREVYLVGGAGAGVGCGATTVIKNLRDDIDMQQMTCGPITDMPTPFAIPKKVTVRRFEASHTPLLDPGVQQANFQTQPLDWDGESANEEDRAEREKQKLEREARKKKKKAEKRKKDPYGLGGGDEEDSEEELDDTVRREYVGTERNYGLLECSVRIEVEDVDSDEEAAYDELEQKHLARIQEAEAGEAPIVEGEADPKDDELPARPQPTLTALAEIKGSLVTPRNADAVHDPTRLQRYPEWWERYCPGREFYFWDDDVMLRAGELPTYNRVSEFVWSDEEFHQQAVDLFHWNHLNDANHAPAQREVLVDVDDPAVSMPIVVKILAEMWATQRPRCKSLGHVAVLTDPLMMQLATARVGFDFALGMPVETFVDKCRECFEQTGVMKMAITMQCAKEDEGIQRLERAEKERLEAVTVEVARRAAIVAEAEHLDDLKLRAQQGDDEALTEYQTAIKQKKDREAKEAAKAVKAAEKVQKVRRTRHGRGGGGGGGGSRAPMRQSGAARHGFAPASRQHAHANAPDRLALGVFRSVCSRRSRR
jgi:hypothetical protein